MEGALPHEVLADVFDFALAGDEMAEIAGLDTASSQFFDHRYPDMVRWLSARRVGGQLSR